MQKREAGGGLVAAAQLAALILLGVILWRVEVVMDQTQREEGSGQVVTSGKVSTERFMEESLEEWRKRHEAAEDLFAEREGGGRD